jgi:hypothetical protein
MAVTEETGSEGQGQGGEGGEPYSYSMLRKRERQGARMCLHSNTYHQIAAILFCSILNTNQPSSWFSWLQVVSHLRLETSGLRYCSGDAVS